ncbi:uncharacterized protein V1518DRAFT_415606 [Limtongia smithiae]|uniref:uncharacterized protein n=1 Tax=Limtongia smithiae TaxID=1125753 RepID=UPI0034CD3925
MRSSSALFRERLQTLPYLTTVTSFVIVLLAIGCSVVFPGLRTALALAPGSVLGGGLYRLVTYPIVHQNVMHALFNMFALLPVLSSFEEDTGTVATAGALLLFSIVPGIAYTVVAPILFTKPPTVLGSSGWVFTLMAYFAMKEFSFRHTIALTPTVQIPTWITPILTLLLVALLLPGSSFLGHLLGLLTGYGYALGYLNPAKLPQGVVLRIEAALGNANLTRLVPRFVSDDYASKHRVVIDTSIDANAPAEGASPLILPSVGPSRSAAFSGHGRALGS